MNLDKADGSAYSRNQHVSHSINSSASLSSSDPEDGLVEEQEPSSSVASSVASNHFPAGSSVLHNIRKNCPWAKRRYAPTLESLHDEVVDLVLWLKPTAEEVVLRRAVYHRISGELKTIYPHAEVEMFGSVATNLFLPSSDIDITIMLSGYTTNDLINVAELFKSLHAFDNVQLVDRAHVPIVKLRHKETQFCIDISFNNNFIVMKNVTWVNTKKNQLPELEPLCLILKQFLAQRGLNHPYNGGLSSYGLILMIVGFLKVYSRKAWRGTSLERAPLGLLLFEFFHFYGHKFKYDEHGLRLRGLWTSSAVIGKEILAKSMNEDKCSSFLFIEDPLQPSNNVGKSAHNMISIKMAFAQSYEFLKNALIQCQYNEFLQYYWGPMLSLVISFTPEEIEYRKFQKNAIVINKDYGITRRSESVNVNLVNNLSNLQSTSDNKAESVADASMRPQVASAPPQFFVLTSVPPPPIIPPSPLLNTEFFSPINNRVFITSSHGIHAASVTINDSLKYGKGISKENGSGDHQRSFEKSIIISSRSKALEKSARKFDNGHNSLLPVNGEKIFSSHFVPVTFPSMPISRLNLAPTFVLKKARKSPLTVECLL